MQVVQVSKVRVVEDTVEIPRLANRGDIADTCPLCGNRRWKVVEIGKSLPSESAQSDVRRGTRLGVSSCRCGAGTIRSPVVGYVTPARTVICAAPVTTITVTSTAFQLRQCCSQTVRKPVGIQQVQILDKFVDLPVVVVRRQVAMILTVQMLAEIPQLQILD